MGKSLDTPPPAGSTVGVTFRPAGRILPHDRGRLVLAEGDLVVVETERGTALGTVTLSSLTVSQAGERAPRVLRKADQRDLARDEINRQREHEALRLCLQRVRDRNMPMKMIGVRYQFDGGKAVFYFAAEGRVDFRELVRDLAQALRTRIEMKQVGARDETKMIGSMGPCGREQCCTSWLREFEAVSVKMAKEQGLSLNPSKLAGMCGRLKCCLRYEYDTYLQLRRPLPRIGTTVATLQGEGQVVGHNALKQTALVRRRSDGVEVEVTLEELVGKRAQ